MKTERQKLYEKIKELNFEELVEIGYGKHYTNCSNDELKKIIKEYNVGTIEDVLNEDITEESKVFHFSVSEEEFKNVVIMAEDAINQAKEAIDRLESFLNIIKSW